MKLLATLACLAALPAAWPLVQSTSPSPTPSSEKAYRDVLSEHLGQEFLSSVTPNGLLQLSLKQRSGQLADSKLVEVGVDYVKLAQERPTRFAFYPRDAVVLVLPE